MKNQYPTSSSGPSWKFKTFVLYFGNADEKMTQRKPTAKKIITKKKKRNKLYYRIFSAPDLRLHLPPDHGWVKRDLSQHPHRQVAAAQPRRNVMYPTGKPVFCWRSFSAGETALRAGSVPKSSQFPASTFWHPCQDHDGSVL